VRIALASQPRRGLRLAVLGLVALLAILVAGIAAAPSVNRLLHVEQIYPGVQVAGIDLSGQTTDQAEATIHSKLQQYEAASVNIRAGDKSLSFTAAELGFRPQEAQLAQAAFAEARDQGALGYVRRAVLGQLLGPAGTPESALVDEQALGAAVAKIAADSYRAPVDASLTLKPQVSLKESVVGQELDQTAAQDIIRQQLLAMKTDDLDLPTTALNPKVTTAQLQPIRDQAVAILARGLTLTPANSVDSRGWAVPSAMLQDSLVLKTSPFALEVQPDAFAPVVVQAARDVYKDAQDATLAITDGQVVLTPDVTGQLVEQSPTLAKAREAIFAGSSTSSLVVTSTPAKVKAADLKPTADRAQAILSKGLTVVVDGTVGQGGNQAVDKTFTATPAEMSSIVSLARGQDGKYTVSLSNDAIGSVIARMSAEYQYPSLTARFVTWSGSRPVIKEGAKVAAIVIDKQAALKAITARINDPGAQDGKVTVSATMGEMTITKPFADRLRADLKGVTKSRSIGYYTASPERSHNIALALSRINGTLVAPGEIYSFNISTGPTTIGAGYKYGFAFTTKGGQNMVVPSEAGGICQVATSVFQPVYLLGYQIEERNYHMFNIGSYAVNGYRGLDATVYPPYADMKFLNNTDHYLLVSSTNHGKSTYVAIVGTMPDWKVSLSKEKITNWVPAPTTPIYTTSPLYASGRVITLEHPTPGFTTEVTRTVTNPDGSVRTLTLKSVYKPSPLQVLRGTG
jgi:vancomycin resistance protein YoaR